MKVSSTFQKEKNLVVYITAGDPSLQATEIFIAALAKGGADIIELGVPYSDPIADGPTNIRAAERALRNQICLQDIFDLVQRMKGKGLSVPIVLFTYYNPVFKMGIKKFAEKASQAGVSGVLFVDLPPEEGTQEIETLHQFGLETIFLCSPTTDRSRLSLINKSSTGFVYYVSRAGVTGQQSTISATLPQEIQNIRDLITKPLVIGFGISNADQAHQMSKFGDGVVVGSAIVSLIEQNEQHPEVAASKIEQFTSELKNSLKS